MSRVTHCSLNIKWILDVKERTEEKEIVVAERERNNPTEGWFFGCQNITSLNMNRHVTL